MRAYDTAVYIDPRPRRHGWHNVHCVVAWSPHNGESVTVEGAYLDATTPNGEIHLGCGIEEALTSLAVDDLLDDHRHVVAITDRVSDQLREHPWAVVRCPLGTVRIDLVPISEV